MTADNTIPDPTFPDHMTDQQILERCLELIYALPGRTDNPANLLSWQWLQPHLSARVSEGPTYRLTARLIALSAPRVTKPMKEPTK